MLNSIKLKDYRSILCVAIYLSGFSLPYSACGSDYLGVDYGYLETLDFKLYSLMGTNLTEDMDAILATGVSAWTRDMNYDTLLHAAAVEGNIENMRWLVEEHGLDVMAVNESGDTPAHYAAQFAKRSGRQYETLVWLVDHGADMYATDAVGETVFDILEWKGCTEVAKQLRQYVESVKTNNCKLPMQCPLKQDKVEVDDEK